MAVTKGEMTSLPTSQTIFLQTVEEPEENRINFRDSLKFFQEQLVINGASFPTPSPSPVCRSANNTLRKNGRRSYKDQNPDINGKVPKDTFESDIQSIKSCKIAIPTVDTILESVRVLRAIQKSQEERGSSWNLDVTSKSDIDYKCTDDWIQVTDVKQNEHTEKECKAEIKGKAPPNNSLDKPIVTDVNQNGYFDKEYRNDKNNETPSANFIEKQTSTDINQNGHFDKESHNERNNNTPSTNCVEKQAVTDVNLNKHFNKESHNDRNNETSTNSSEKQTVSDINQNEYSNVKSSNAKNNESHSSNSTDKQTVVGVKENGYFDEESNNEKNDETYSTSCGDNQINADVNHNDYSVEEHKSSQVPSTNSVEKHTSSDKKQTESSDKESNNERNNEPSSTNSVDEQMVTDINQNEYFDKESENESTEKFSTDSEAADTIVETQVNDTNNNLPQSCNDSQITVPIANSINEICSFWPTNTLQNGNHCNEEKKTMTLEKNENSEILDEIDLNKHVDKTDSFQFNEKSFEIKPSNKENLTEQIEQNDSYDNILQNINTPKNSNHLRDLHECVTKNTEICDTPDSLRAVCTDLLSHLNQKSSDTTEITKEMLLNGSETATAILKIETYEGIDAQKHDPFLLNESLWKENCSPSDSTSTKIEHNDSDSGIGTQRSASSLSPNNPNQMQKDSWSDTCSSHYASAECSPYHSLNSVFESSLGLNSTLGETRENENAEILTQLTESEWEDAVEKPQQDLRESLEEDHSKIPQENKNESPDDQSPVIQGDITESPKDYNTSVPQQTDCDKEKDHISDNYLTGSHIQTSDFESHSENAELDTEISYCNFITNYTIEKPCERIEEELEEVQPASEICDNSVTEPKILNGQESTYEQNIDVREVSVEETFDVEKAESFKSLNLVKEDTVEDDSCDLHRVQKFSAASCDLISIVESLYTIKENPAYQVLQTGDGTEEKFEESLFILSKGAFCEHSEDNYLVTIEDSILYITKDSQILLSLNMKYGEVSVEMNILRIDNRMGRCIYVRCEFADALTLQARIKLHCLKHWQADCLQLVHYPLKCHQNVVIIDIGSCSTRAGILMDQPTLPSLFFPTICATDKRTGTCVYGMEALQPEVRQHSNLSFPVRPTIKITKHTIDIDLMEGLFKKIFHDLNVDPTQYTVQVCLPRNLSINAQTALVKLLLESLKVKSVSLTNQALLTLYAHDVSTAVVVDIGDRTDVLPVVDGFIVENGVTKLPHGGQRLIHHMKHSLAEKRLSLSNDIDSFIVQYIIENLAYVAEDYGNEIQITSQYPDIITKAVMLQPASSESVPCKSITLEEARFKIPEGLFNPELWGLDSPGIHHLVQKAIQATSVDARKRVAENIYVSGGVTMLPGFIERLHKEVTKLSKVKIVPKVYASNYRYHCTYIGACKFAKMDVFPQVCITLQEYTKNSASALKKCALYF